MRYLKPALIAEGVSDDRFLPFLLYRSLEDLCLTEFDDPVDVDQVSSLRQHQRPPNEAWLLADGDALRSSLGVRWSDADMGVPRRPKDVEAIVDPKIPIRRLEQRRNRSIEDFFEEIAESVSLDVLREVPSFAAFERQTISALTDMGYRRLI
ncbi:hypothetical protein ACFY36_24030 [Actinoplanes sp. NPDC000266]